jgi:hypothetical protein
MESKGWIGSFRIGMQCAAVGGMFLEPKIVSFSTLTSSRSDETLPIPFSVFSLKKKTHSILQNIGCLLGLHLVDSAE